MRGLPTKLPATFRTTTALRLWLHPRDVYALRDAGVLTQLSYGVFRRNDAPPTTVFRFASATFEVGLSKIEATPGEYVRIYDQERTVVDLVRLERGLSIPGMPRILQRYLSAEAANPELLLEYADALGAQEPVRAALDAAASSGNRGTQGSESRE
ncbi:hypothetical protein [Glaciibacter superstes]|uniref:hypothetical protein n=1 Tax=Glaciibacter superstes TaxID=501023 RepID=UPI0003B3904D|nr:hypothetical protein [Glaciibacter superstes]